MDSIGIAMIDIPEDQETDAVTDLETAPELDPKMDTEKDTNMDPENDPKMDPEKEFKMDPEMDPKMDSKMDPKMDPEMDPKMDNKMDPKMDPEMGPKIAPMIEPEMGPATNPETDPSTSHENSGEKLKETMRKPKSSKQRETQIELYNIDKNETSVDLYDLEQRKNPNFMSALVELEAQLKVTTQREVLSELDAWKPSGIELEFIGGAWRVIRPQHDSLRNVDNLCDHAEERRSSRSSSASFSRNRDTNVRDRLIGAIGVALMLCFVFFLVWISNRNNGESSENNYTGQTTVDGFF